MNRPVSLIVVVIGWFLFAGFSLITCLLGFVNLIQFQIAQGGGSTPMPTGAPAWMGYLIVGNYALNLVETGLTVLALMSAYYLWQLRAWARTSLEVLSWLGLVAFGGFALLWLGMWLPMSGHLTSLPTGFIVMACAAFAIPVAFVFAFGASIRILRGRTVREAVAQATAQTLVEAF